MNTTSDSPPSSAPAPSVTLRPLERGDLHFVHVLNNNRSVMGYWFEEPYEPSSNSKSCTASTSTISPSAASSSRTAARSGWAWSNWSRSTICIGARNS
ncbi:hypothetical protein [Lysobacter capsici]|uniref:hypothetical protein n=1 Tax=Lysobacter capsici TaxID=435897 RepID=UPI00398D4192